ncbi:MAG: MauE/DoxX family redox-associated membrane protein [Jatrophihabitantaceae bacterium]
MNWSVARPWLGTVARLLLGVVWIWAALSKLAHPLTFVQAVRAYDATPEWLSKAIGYGLPMLELCLGVALVIGIVVRVAAIASGALLLVFLIGLIQASARGISLNCGCFGGGGTTDGATSYTLDILRDVGLLIAAAFLVVWSMTRLSIEAYLARHDAVPMPSAKRMRTPEGRRRYEAQLAVSRAKAGSRTRYVDGSIALVVVLVSIVAIGVQAGRAKIGNVVVGVNATSAGIGYGKPAAATVDVYEDFGCPVCKQFETDVHAQLEKDVRANLVQVRYHPIAILDSRSPNRYSSRAANAAVCVSDVGVDQFVAYHDLLYGGSTQPTEGTAGPGDARLTALARQASVPTAKATTVSNCILGKTYDPLVAQYTDKASQRGINSTPTILVNGKQLPDHSASTLFAAIALANVGHTPSPSPTPVPSTPSVTVSPSPAPSPSPSSAKPSPSA